MRGRQVFMDSLRAHGVERIFGNPGTTESPLLDSLAAYPDIRYVTVLQESIALCAASFYAQASGKTGVVSVHVAPGLGNAMGMLFCAMRANSALVVTAGQQDTRMRLSDPVLGHDLVAMAAPVTKWSVQVERADEMGPILRARLQGGARCAGRSRVRGIADRRDGGGDLDRGVDGGTAARMGSAPAEAVAEIAGLVRAARAPTIVCGDDVARSGASASLVAFAETIGASVWFESLLHVQNAFPTAHASCRLGVGQDSASTRKALGDADLVLLIGGPFFEDVWFAAGSPFPHGARVAQIEESPARLAYNHPLTCGTVGDLRETLGALTRALAGDGALRAASAKRNSELAALKAREVAAQQSRAEKAWDRTPASMPRVMAEIRDALPRNAIVVDETVTAAIDLARTLDFAAPGDYFGAKGGGIGQGLAGALGVQAAMPDRPVICLSGDGSAMYSIQALWTAAHLAMPIVFVILVNREYRVLKHNIDVYRQRFGIASQEPYAHMDLGAPALGFVEMAAGMGVAGTRVLKPDGIGPAIAAALQSKRPHLIEIAIEAKR